MSKRNRYGNLCENGFDTRAAVKLYNSAYANVMSIKESVDNQGRYPIKSKKLKNQGNVEDIENGI